MSSPSDQIRDDLRRQAEQRVPTPTTNVSQLPVEEIQRLVYELEVHQEELAIQNEELRRVQIELVASRERYADLYDFAPVGYLTLDAVGKILKLNLKAATMLGHDRTRLTGARLGQYCEPGSRICLRDHLETLRTIGQSQSCELEFAAPDKTVWHSHLDSNPIAHFVNDIWQCRVAMTDITERKIAEQALAEKDEHLRSVTNALPVLIGYIDTTLKFQWSNSAYQAWFEHSPDDIPGLHVRDVIGRESANELADYFYDALAGRRVDIETRLTHQETGLRHVQMMLIPDFGPDRKVKGVYSLSLDITDRIVVEEQHARRRNYAERLVRLNANERAIYDLLINGKSNKAIANELDIGLRTAERRRKTILNKLNVETFAELLQQLAKSNE